MTKNLRKKINQELPLVAICGRTNVGKSTLFNCLTEKKQALISDIAGTTRDSNLGFVEWARQSFELVDTAGLLDSQILTDKKISGEDIDSQTQKQARSYLWEAALILFIVDAKAGLLSEDKKLAAELKKNPKYREKVLLVANKVDSFRTAGEAAPFHRLGLGDPIIISAASGLGTGDLLDLITEKLAKRKNISKPANKNTNSDEEIIVNPDKGISACLIGKPNVGKSSLLNAILGYERVIVSPVPHTTREPQNTEITYQDKKITLVDTAGIARHSRNVTGFEKDGIVKSLKSLEKADIALLVMDISEPLTHQDAKLVQEIVDRQKSLIFIANKWDLVEGRDTKKWAAILYDKLPFATWAPTQFISAKTGEKVNKILESIIAVATQRQLLLSDSQTEKFLKHVVKIHKPAKGKGLKAPHIYEFRQTKNNPPSFVLRIGPNDNLHFSYVRFLENRLRERHGFIGTPLSIRVTKNKKSHTTYNEPSRPKKIKNKK
ncbi:TPA: ribosome biogenesis GTPase Der [Candidatus Falkowbacteria bacterium]|nr:MAG: GTPase Der [Candidatus Falkowbacteria bacterium GW2011_GWF2_43_32]HBA36302.1 ribosome biogenesis GTPase Der [Candidatus Falkowbacteria bacterium]